MSKFLKIILILFFLLFFCKNQVFAADECVNSNPPPDLYDSDYVCQIRTEYGCPWGTEYGNDVGRRTARQYCTGLSADCTGAISYGDWYASDSCSDCEYCVPGETTCASVLPPLWPSDGATGVKTPTVLDWCDNRSARSYLLKIYEIDSDGNEQDLFPAVPGLVTTKSEFCIDPTADTEYLWQVASCVNDNGTDCGDFSDKWSFTANGTITINGTTLSAPAHGATNVQLPVTLRWSNVWNAKSYFVIVSDLSDLFSDPIYMGITNTNQVTIGTEECLVKNGLYIWSVAACFNDDGTRCGTGCCDNDSGYECDNFPSARGFQVSDSVVLPPPELKTPPYSPAEPVPIVYPSDQLSWKKICGAPYYRYQVLSTAIDSFTDSNEVAFDILWGSLNLGTEHRWRVKSCWGDQANECGNTWSSYWRFKTAGGTPAGLIPTNGATNVVIPVELDWDDVEGAISYHYQVSSDAGFNNIIDENFVRASRASVDYPAVTISTTYWWRVKSCVDSKNEVCGPWATRSFTTGGLNQPSTPSPSNNGTLFTYKRNISWDPSRALNPGARYYRYKIDYASKPAEEVDPRCVAGQEVIPFTTIPSNSSSISINCLGGYNWWVQACLDEGCTITGPLGPEWHFTLIQPEPPAQFGILPCNRVSDNPKTLWNERDSCELKHIVLVFKGILDFVLWEAGLIALVLLVVATAVIYFFSLGGPSVMTNVKSLWKRAGQGYAIMLLSWVIINLLVKFIGFTDAWWTLPF